jgi:hypothetical protein
VQFVFEIEIGMLIGPLVETIPQDLVGVAAYATIGVYTTVLLGIVPGDETLW